MFSALYFNSTLSNQDVAFLASATSDLQIQPECRCPPSHPIALEHECEDTSGSERVSRINTAAHEPALLSDGQASTWWQSVTGEAPVNITVGLGGLREATSVAIHFRSLLPRAMILHYSTDGVNFSPRQYYAADCSIFGREDNRRLISSTDVNCITTHSFPLTNQFAEFQVLDVNRPGAETTENFNLSPELQQFAQATHIMIELVEWNTQDPSGQYFAINEVMVQGQACVCSGHASACTAASCVCQHGTAGAHCDTCLPLHNGRPWRAGTTTSANACELCDCNGHAASCTYDTTAELGICDNCTDNTRGLGCESCSELYFWSSQVPFSSPAACQPCACHPPGIADSGDCLRGDNADGSDSGQCSCKEFVSGRACDRCSAGYFNLSASVPQGCVECGCNMTGTVGGSGVCTGEGGQCPCKPNVVGRTCSSCADNHFGITREDGCAACHAQCLSCTGPMATDCQVSNAPCVVAR